MKLYNKFQKQLDDIATKKKTFEMQITKQSIHQIIGAKGKTIKKIEKISGAEIKTDTSTGILNITAENSDSLTIAKELINKVISNPTNAMLEMKDLPKYKMDRLPEAWNLLGVYTYQSVELESLGDDDSRKVIFDEKVSEKTAGILYTFGITDQILKEIKSLSGAAIIHKKVSYAVKISSPNPEYLSKAKALIRNIISIEKSKSTLFKQEALNLLEKCEEEDESLVNMRGSISDEDECEILIPKRFLPIWKTIIPKIHSLTKAEVQVWRLCTIKILGDDSESVLKAKELLTTKSFLALIQKRAKKSADEKRDQNRHESETKPNQIKKLQSNHSKTNESSILNSVTETELKPNEDQNKLELGTKPKKMRNQRRAKKSIDEKRTAQENMD